jgi:hypothetical protein
MRQSAQLTLEAAGLGDELRVGGEATRALNQHGVVLRDEPDHGTGGRPQVFRRDLRRIALRSLGDEIIRWGCRITGVQPLGSRGGCRRFRRRSRRCSCRW